MDGYHTSYALDASIARLRQIFADSANAMYLRGSLIRGERPYDDIDIIEVGTTPHDTRQPDAIEGIRVSYHQASVAAWDMFLQTCPRSWSILYEGVKLHKNNYRADAIFDREREQLKTKRADYLAYRAYEAKIITHDPISSPPSQYKVYKEAPGSKRTIMRAVFMLKALHPELQDMQTPELLRSCSRRGIVPPAIPTVVERVYGALARRPIDPVELRPFTETCAAWMRKLLIEVDEKLALLLPSSYLTLLHTAARASSEIELTWVYYQALLLRQSYRRWTVMYLLSYNPYFPSHLAREIQSQSLADWL